MRPSLKAPTFSFLNYTSTPASWLARGDKPSQQLPAPQKREVPGYAMSAKVIMSATRGRTACVEVEEDLRAVAHDRG